MRELEMKLVHDLTAPVNAGIKIMHMGKDRADFNKFTRDTENSLTTWCKVYRECSDERKARNYKITAIAKKLTEDPERTKILEGVKMITETPTEPNKENAADHNTAHGAVA